MYKNKVFNTIGQFSEVYKTEIMGNMVQNIMVLYESCTTDVAWRSVGLGEQEKW